MISEPHGSWITVLDRIERDLADTIERTQVQEPAPPGEKRPDWNPLAVLDDHLGQLEQHLARADAGAAETDALLASSVAELRRWLDAVEVTRRRLTQSPTGPMPSRTPPAVAADPAP